MKRLRTIKKHIELNKTNRGLYKNLSKNMSGVVYQPVKITEHGNLVNVHLNRPEKLNSLNLDMVRFMSPKYIDWMDSSEVKCVLLTAEGSKAFCAGGDVAAIQREIVQGKAGVSGSLSSDFFYEEYCLNNRIASLYPNKGISHVSIWDGIVMGGGVGLSVHGNFRVCTEKSLFAMPETGIGLFPDVGGTHVLSRLQPNLATGMYLALTGKRLKKDDLLYSGLATHFLPSQKVPEFVDELKKLPEISKTEIHELILRIQPDQSFVEDSSLLFQNTRNISHCFSQLSVMDIFMEVSKKAEGNNPWAMKTQEELSRMSPTSLRVTFEAIHRHSGQVTLAEALKNEYRLSQRFMRNQPDSDFVEGIRAVLVDKDNSPKWSPESISHVDKKVVSAFFAELGDTHPRGELEL